jgi:hypothetical protein
VAADYYDTLGGRNDTARISGILAWRCADAPPPAAPPTPLPDPKPACPGTLEPGEIPPLPEGRLEGAGTTAPGLTGSITFETCNSWAGDDTPWLVPGERLRVSPSDELAVRLTNDYRLLWFSAIAVPADEQPDDARDNVVELGERRAHDAVVGPLPAGDWVVLFHVIAVSHDRSVVVRSPYYFRVVVGG